MPGFKVRKELSRQPAFLAPCLHKSLPNAFICVGASRKIQQTLICFGVLDDGRGPALHCQNDRPLTFLKLLHEIAGAAAEGLLKLAVLADLRRRPASEVRGPKRAWALAMVVNSAGVIPVASAMRVVISEIQVMRS